MLAGQVITGACVSLTVTVNEQVAVLPAASRAVYVTVVTPTLKDWLEGTVLMPVAAEAPVVAPVNAQVLIVTAQLSAFVGAGVANTAAHMPGVLLAVMFAGQVIVGGWLSTTVIVNEQLGPA